MRTDQPDLTTAELLDRCEEATSVRFTVHQLGDWVKAGLLPPSRRGKGKGRGEGSEARRWDAECLARVILIAQSRTGEYVSVSRAAQVLTIKGYPPLKADLLRSVLRAYIADVEHEIMSKRTYLRRKHLSAEEKRRRLIEGLERRNPGLAIAPGDRAWTFDTAAGLAGYPDPRSEESASHTATLFSPEVLQTTLAASDGATLLAAYGEANAIVTQVLPYLTVLMQATPPTKERLAAGERASAEMGRKSPRLGSTFTERLLTGALSFDAADVIRVLLVLVLMVAHAHPEPLEESAERHGPSIQDLFARLGAVAAADADDEPGDAPSPADQHEEEGQPIA
jgi:hypothetical protein